MADDYRFGSDLDQTTAPKERKSGWQTCLTGCLIAFVILVVLGILVGIWVARNLRDWAATLATEGIRQGIEASQLPPGEKQEIMVEVERFATAFREKKVSNEQLQIFAERLINSPLMSLVVASTIEQHYFANSGLSAEEKTEGHQTLQRFIRGSIDEKINKAGIDAAMAHVADRDAQGQWKLRQTLNDESLRAFLAEAKKQADAAGIPEQPAVVDPSDEFKKLVDEAMNAPAAAR